MTLSEMDPGSIRNPAEFSNWNSYLDHLRSLKFKGKSLPLRVWSGQFGVKSVRLSGMILKGQRLPTREVLAHFFAQQKFPPAQRKVIELFVEKERRQRKSKPTQALDAELKKQKLWASPKSVRGVEQIQEIAQWYCSVLEIMAMEPDFVDDPQVLAKRLRGKVSPADITDALEHLERQGKIQRPEITRSGELLKGRRAPRISHWRVESPVPSRTIREHHKQMLARAAEAMDDLPVQNRFICSLTFPMAADDYRQASEMLNDFREKFNARFNRCERGEYAVYQLNLQLFPHTTSEKK